MQSHEMVPGSALDEMVAYYRARADEYDEWFYRRGRYDRGPDLNRRWFDEVAQVEAALDAAALGGDVLELAPGTGIWTQRLAGLARSLTVVDASPEMLALCRARVASDHVSFIQADLFSWQPARRYDAVFFGFWLSHVPRERLDAFLALVAAALRPGGALFFVDSRREPTSTAVDHRLPEAAEAQTLTRQLNDGRSFRIVKNFYQPDVLAARCAAAGCAVEVHETPTYFIYGAGARL